MYTHTHTKNNTHTHTCIVSDCTVFIFLSSLWKEKKNAVKCMTIYKTNLTTSLDRKLFTT